MIRNRNVSLCYYRYVGSNTPLDLYSIVCRTALDYTIYLPTGGDPYCSWAMLGVSRNLSLLDTSTVSCLFTFKRRISLQEEIFSDTFRPLPAFMGIFGVDGRAI